ncbi:SctI family type III secretion system inner rod subunit BscI [Bordetella pertussis]|uniref:SctI family type III secretion system inner rod subunit BscI n=1 Tax=Bordetella pertussis TaxID=520 RepID=UPI0005DFF539|nr:SctI family type III secretion system inner rod subunit BscI [Bordetella pertussis]CFM75329.1 type III secretion protein [Bordetella pertussis]CFN84038.1 type III secretion protein [Bordetella pertussis]CFV94221.1 type III secretion protein [Bordetella pertussis]CPO19553.1 type III secretion protein [Bordetella pertussis]
MNLDLTAINAVQERLLAGSFDMPRSPAMADQARFELALGEMPGASAPNEAIALAPVALDEPLGRRILGQLRGGLADVAGKWRAVQTGLAEVSQAPTVVGMLDLQARLLQASVEYELVGKAIGRATQNVDTLARMS